MAESRRLRTQAERHRANVADGTAWRATAASRPGYATYPQTPPGSPSWWTRHGQPVITADDLASAHVDLRAILTKAVEQAAWDAVPGPDIHYGPPPVDGETCKRWCGFCHLNNSAEPEPPPRVDFDLSWVTTENIRPQRRRWWHRYTRPTRKD